jgi:amidase
MAAQKPAWLQAAEAKRARTQELIPSAWRLPELPPSDQLDVRGIARTSGILSARELEITEQDDCGTLLSKLATGDYSAVEVTTAYCKRAAIAQQLLNCCTELLFDDAIERAKALDAHFAEHGKPIGSLHGLPVSLKDQFDIKGVEMTMGYASWVGKVSDHDAVAVTLLRQAGAVIHVRTNLPQTIMWGETANHVWGLTVNAFRRDLTCGGSSGGEGALIGFKGSPVGFGTCVISHTLPPFT